MKDVLLPIGSLFLGGVNEDQQETYLVIGTRIINHETMRCWDYVAVPLGEGMKRKIEKNEKHFENFYYCNHYEITKIIKVSDLDEATTTSAQDTE